MSGVSTGPSTQTEDADADRRRRHWRHNLRLTFGLLVLGFVVTFVVPYYARELSFSFFGWPFSFWVAGQGALLVYLLIIHVYARRMERLDVDCGLDEERD